MIYLSHCVSIVYCIYIYLSILSLPLTTIIHMGTFSAFATAAGIVSLVLDDIHVPSNSGHDISLDTIFCTFFSKS